MMYNYNVQSHDSLTVVLTSEADPQSPVATRVVSPVPRPVDKVLFGGTVDRRQ